MDVVTRQNMLADQSLFLVSTPHLTKFIERERLQDLGPIGSPTAAPTRTHRQHVVRIIAHLRDRLNLIVLTFPRLVSMSLHT